MARLYDLTPEAFAEVANLADEAIVLAPTYARAHLMRAAAFLHRLCFGEITHDPESIDLALKLAKKAVDLAPQDEYSHWNMAFAYAEAGRLEEAVIECDVWLAKNPNWLALLADKGDYLAFLGRPEEAIEICRQALRVNPGDPSNFWRHSSLATAHFVAENYIDALEEAKRVAVLKPEFPRGPILWAAAAAALHKTDEAQAAVGRCRKQWPDLCIRNVVPHFMMEFARKADRKRLLALLRKAGLPE
jgi:adenylate cyclase